MNTKTGSPGISPADAPSSLETFAPREDASEEGASPVRSSSAGRDAHAPDVADQLLARSGPPARKGVWGWLLSLLGFGRARDDAAKELGQGASQEASLRTLLKVPVGEIAVPRAEIVAVEDDICLEDLVDVFRKSKFSRLPVYHGTLDEPIGLVHLKDLALEYGFRRERKPFNLKGLLRPLIYAPPAMPAGRLLQKMKSQRTHMALIIDEYGGVDGLVTLEDLVETVIGEIEDEHDQIEETPWKREGERVWLVNATAPLDEFEAESGVSLETEESREEDIDTLGGLVFILAGRVPARGEIIRHPDGHEFEIVDADPRRIRKLRLRLAPPSKGAEAPVEGAAG